MVKSTEFYCPCTVDNKLILSTKQLRRYLLTSRECDIEDRFLYPVLKKSRSNSFRKLIMRAFFNNPT